MNSKLLLFTTYLVITASFVGCTQETKYAEPTTKQNLYGMDTALEKIAQTGDKKSVSDIGIIYLRAVTAEKELLEPVKPLVTQLQAAKTDDERKKLASEILTKIQPATQGT